MAAGAPKALLRAPSTPRRRRHHGHQQDRHSGTVARTVTAMIVIAMAMTKPSPISPINGGVAADAAMAPV